jgi:acetolactate decarboxylase
MQIPMRIVVVLWAGAIGPCLQAGEHARRDGEALFQVSTLSELAAGDYDGRLSFRDLAAHGSFGLGTFDHLDGEMVAVDGRFFQVRADGVATPVRASETTPFAVVTSFEPDIRFEVHGDTSCDALRDTIESRLPSEDALYAVEVTGLFSYLETRSVPPQEKPYVPLAEALQNEVVFPLYSVEATMVGFWLPAVLDDVNAAGFHFHALTRDETTGGHVLDCDTLNVRVEIDRSEELQVRFGTRRGHRPPRRPRPTDVP